MDAKYLDQLLNKVNVARNNEVKAIFIEHEVTDVIPALNFLENKGYIGNQRVV